MKVILVTGAAGFLGSTLIRKLLENDNNFVVGIDDFSSSSGDNLEDLYKHQRFSFYEHNVVKPFELMLADEIYHLACPASPKYYQEDPLKTLKTCFLGTLNMLELAYKRGAKLLLTSTSEIYGEPLEHPQAEEYRGNVSCIGPRAVYDEGKRVSETLCMTFHKEHHRRVPITIVRLFNTYGPGMMISDGRVVSNFIVSALKNEPITIYGSGNQTRSFCYVDDTIRGLIRAMNSDNTGPINIGNPTERTILELAELILEKTESSSKLVHEELPVDDPTKRKPDITKARELLAWEPEIDLEEGLQKTIGFFRDII